METYTFWLDINVIILKFSKQSLNLPLPNSTVHQIKEQGPYLSLKVLKMKNI